VDARQLLGECKARGRHMRGKYGDAGTDQMLEADIIQVALQCLVLDRPAADLAVLFDKELEVFHYERDKGLEDVLIETANRFYTDHMKTGKPPAPDSTKECEEVLKRTFPKVDEAKIIRVEDGHDLFRLVDEYKATTAALKELEAEKQLLTNTLREAMQDCPVIESSLGRLKRIVSKTGKGRASVNYKKVVEQMVRDGLLTKEAVDAVAENYISHGKPMDYIRATWSD